MKKIRKKLTGTCKKAPLMNGYLSHNRVAIAKMDINNRPRASLRKSGTKIGRKTRADAASSPRLLNIRVPRCAANCPPTNINDNEAKSASGEGTSVKRFKLAEAAEGLP